MADHESVYVNGEWMGYGGPHVSVFDHGFLYGDGVFETLFAMYGYVFKLEQHLARLDRSLRAIDLKPPLALNEIGEIAIEATKRTGLSDAYIKIIVTRGVTEEPLLDPRGARTSLIVLARPYLSVANAEKAGKGLRAKLTSIRRVASSSLDPRIKSLNYLNLVLAKIDALKSGFDDALLLDDAGNVCEGPGYNVFTVADGTVLTPRSGVLEGVTRETVLELCEKESIPFVVRDLAPYDVYVASEVFLTSTAGGLLSVTEVDGRRIGDGRPGAITLRLTAAYDELLRSGRCGTPLGLDSGARASANR
jgi:branched-chain amino acid aminotransferase